MGNAILAGQTVRGSVGSASRRSHAVATGRVDIPAEINSAPFRAGDLTLPEEEQLAVLKMAFFARWPTVHPHPPARPPRGLPWPPALATAAAMFCNWRRPSASDSRCEGRYGENLSKAPWPLPPVITTPPDQPELALGAQEMEFISVTPPRVLGASCRVHRPPA